MATIEVKLKPFSVPNFALLDEASSPGTDGPTSVPLSALDAETLDVMCEDFRRAVFEKARKQQPPRAADPR